MRRTVNDSLGTSVETTEVIGVIESVPFLKFFMVSLKMKVGYTSLLLCTPSCHSVLCSTYYSTYDVKKVEGRNSLKGTPLSSL